MSNYDNTNRGAVWAVTAHTGRANVAGNEFQAALVPTGAKSDAAPLASMVLTSKNGSHVIAMFKPTREAKFVLSGKCDALGVRAFVFRNEEKKSDKSPDYTFSFLDLTNQQPEDEQAKSMEPFW